MEKHLLPAFAILFISLSFCRAQTSILQTKTNTGWTVTHPFVHRVFIENKGQFTDEEKKDIDQPILFYNRLGKIRMYFSATSLTFRYDSVEKMEDANVNQGKFNDPDINTNTELVPQYLKMTWQNANPNVDVEVQEPESDYFTYGNPADKSGHSGIVAHAWEKLIYHNLYNGIDVEFYYPDKGGIEYNIIVHPGADLSEFKMGYSGNVKIALHGNDANILSQGFNLVDHAPIAKNENSVSTSFSVNNNIISFKAGNYDKTQTLTIDPWFYDPGFFVWDIAYDIDNDNSGNIYVAGGQPPYELEQYDSSGKLIWTYNTVTSFGGPSVWYGGFTTDMRNGTSYMIKGLGNDALAKAVKVNNAGIQVAQNIQEINIELWRVAFDYINNQLVVAAGLNYQAALIDTNLNSINDVTLGSGLEANDMSLLALDNQGNAYMGFNKSSFGSTKYNNVILKLPLPSLFPVSDTFSDHYNFTEFLSMYYYAPQINNGYDYSNGFNGMAANKKMLVTYDGASLKKWHYNVNKLKETDSIKVSSSSFQWGGLDLDCESNIYAGNNKSFMIYDSSLTLMDSVKLDSIVYALKVGNGKLYACGFGFVQSANIPASANTVINVAANPTSYCAGGSSVITASGGASYTWSPSYGLSATSGSTVTANPTVTTTYTITGTNKSGCAGDTTITVVITVGTNLTITVPTPNPICDGNSTILTASGATNYTWTPATGLSATTGDSVIASPITTTTYTVIGSNNANACADTVQVIVVVNAGVNKPVITLQGNVLTSTATQGNQWYRNGTEINGATNETYNVTDTGCYWSTATNIANGCNTNSDTICITTLTGISQLTINRGQLTVYPNPIGGEVFINISSSVADVKDWNLLITDVLGRRVFTKQSLNYSNDIDLANLASGVYFIAIINKTGRIVMPVIKQ